MSSLKLTIATLVAISVSVSACKNKDAAPGAEPTATKPTEVAPGSASPPPAAPAAKLVAVDLSAAGDAFKGYTIQAPEGATAADSFGSAQVKSGDGFQLEISANKADIAGKKKGIAANDVNKMKRYVVDAPDALLYESEVMGHTEFHFYAAAPGLDLTCWNVKGPEYTQAQAEAMLKACQSIKKH